VKKLIAVDIGGTCCEEFDKPGAREILRDLQPNTRLPDEISRQLLHEAPATPETVTAVCNKLLIDEHEFYNRIWEVGGFTPFPYTVETLAALREFGRVVAYSNLDSLSGPLRMEQFRAVCGPHIDGSHASFETGYRKPSPQAWKWLSLKYRAPLSSIVNIGNQTFEDVRGLLALGQRAIWIRAKGEDIPLDFLDDPLTNVLQEPDDPKIRDWRVAIVEDLRGAVPVIRAWTR
jgi:FMN phosphatase YigB (HAD superfamily)